MKTKRNLLLVFYLLAGIIVGSLVGSLCADVSFLRWLSFGGSVGFSPDAPFVLDLHVLVLTFGFSFTITVAQIIFIALAIFLYNKTSIR